MRLKHSDADKASDAFNDEFEKSTKTTVRQAAQSAQREILSTGAFKGTSLRRSFKVTQVGPYEQELSTQRKHASYVEDGTEPHKIRARNAKVLRFVQSGETVFRKVVNHPGTKPTKFFQTATENASQKMIRDLDANAHRLAGKFNKKE